MNPDAQHKFVERYLREQHRLYGYIATLVPSRSDAEEIFQETSLLLWEKWEEFDQNRDLMPWACGIAHNLVRNHLRKNRPFAAHLDDPFLQRIADTRLEMEDELAPRRQALTFCLEKLTEKKRTLLEQCYGDAVSKNELAAQTGITANALYLKLRRIRATLMDCINRRIAEDDA